MAPLERWWDGRSPAWERIWDRILADLRGDDGSRLRAYASTIASCSEERRQLRRIAHEARRRVAGSGGYVDPGGHGDAGGFGDGGGYSRRCSLTPSCD
ncbi:hypothetical protein GCM10009557_31040 [Virgisporangium ochraceum]|uniref:Uncharacterized protein n=1 Tax=Virgisporangium ochraceum TaxID=65505 RepID=A0A8J4A7L5_9ACTN|nr:hypothetical protein [Virgisporangium ochraceum]GIJ74840.1 hypothetical protein Voc01_097570 [Virgisporangium ochraceum]